MYLSVPCKEGHLKGASRLNQCLSYIVQNGTLICRNIFIFCSGRIKAFRLHHLVIKNTLRTLTFDSLDLHPLPLWTFTHHYSADLHFNLESPFKNLYANGITIPVVNNVPLAAINEVRFDKV